MAVLKQTSPATLVAAPDPAPSKNVPSASITPPRENGSLDSAIGNCPWICAKIGMRRPGVNHASTKTNPAFSIRCTYPRIRIASLRIPKAALHGFARATQQRDERSDEEQG